MSNVLSEVFLTNPRISMPMQSMSIRLNDSASEWTLRSECISNTLSATSPCLPTPLQPNSRSTKVCNPGIEVNALMRSAAPSSPMLLPWRQSLSNRFVPHCDGAEMTELILLSRVRFISMQRRFTLCSMNGAMIENIHVLIREVNLIDSQVFNWPIPDNPSEKWFQSMSMTLNTQLTQMCTLADGTTYHHHLILLVILIELI